ncbi:H-NS histone family protein [Serratia nevei]|uniref:H-NS histone family protein n=1 Tax=Serratia nevei TaxID=2703794 RepID=UPI00209F8457|nr:H-NS histone family protein [Serratia nevei]MCP1107740.1 H-NS histone family protein [Serratia nevei]
MEKTVNNGLCPRCAATSEVQRLRHELAALDERIEAVRSTERREALAQVQGLIDQFVLTRREVFDTAAARPLVSGRAVAQPARDPDIYGIYRDPVTGQTWDGSGRLPKWLKGKQRELYLVIG